MVIDYLRVTVEHRTQVCELTVSGEEDGISGSTDKSTNGLSLGLRWAARTKLSPAIPAGW